MTCECGCGGIAPIAKVTCRKRGQVKGQPMRFIHGHQHKGARANNWRGGVCSSMGYRSLWVDGVGHVLEHVLVAERALGKPLPPWATVHHVNEDRSDNRPQNLVICESQAYHMLLHQRMRALAACGNANWRKCSICKTYDDPANLRLPTRPGKTSYHLSCSADRAREYRARRRATDKETASV